MHPWHDISWGTRVEDGFQCIIEIPAESKVKYELDKATGLLKVDRVLYSAVHYPANYGFIPRTYCGDGDPLDVLLLGQLPLVPLALARGRALGVFAMVDDKGQDDKIVAVHLDDPEYAHYRDASELPPHKLAEIQRFFMDYKVLENKGVAIEQLQGRADAERVVREAVELYEARETELRAGRS
jgi:inorganic pyrophosphatase